jgi:hypothetical protein
VLDRRKTLAAFAAVLTISSMASPIQATEAKRDIRGFYPRMSNEAFIAGLKALNCTISCEVDNGRISFNRSELSGRPLREIVYVFKSGTPMDKMVGRVAHEYGVQPPAPSKLKEAIKTATRGHPTYSPGWFGTPKGVVYVPGGILAKWSLNKGLWLQLEVAHVEPPFEYKLFLFDDSIVREEREQKSRMKAKDEADRRAINPTPKF